MILTRDVLRQYVCELLRYYDVLREATATPRDSLCMCSACAQVFAMIGPGEDVTYDGCEPRAQVSGVGRGACATRRVAPNDRFTIESNFSTGPYKHTNGDRCGTYTATFCPTAYLDVSTFGPNSQIVPENLVGAVKTLARSKHVQ